MNKITYDPSVVLQWESIGEVMLMITTSEGEHVPMHLWGPFIEDLISSPTKAIFAFVVGSAGINATQRSTVATVFRDKGIVATVVTDDRMTRGMLTALSWLGAAIKPFSWNDVDKAANNVPCDPADRAALDEFAARVVAMRADRLAKM